jgi:sugar transferase (PEP-CTERM/EpsH1 system associated)
MRVLFLTHRLPYAPNRGDRIRSYYIARTLASHVDLTVASLVHDEHEEAQAPALRDLGMSVVTFRTSAVRGMCRAAAAMATERPLTHALLDARGMSAGLRRLTEARRPDVVLSYCSGMARFALTPVFADRPLVLDMVDVDSQKWTSLADTAGWGKGWIYRREARSLARFERQAAERMHTTLVVNEREWTALRRIAPGARVHVLRNGIDAAAFAPPAPPTEEPRVVFCGVMNYEPNVDAALWLSRHVWPLVRAKRPDARLLLVGSSPSRAVAELPARDRTIEVTGTVPDVRPYLWSSAVAVAPLVTARGVQNKVLEAIAAGLPMVVTPAVFDGLHREVQPACQVGADPQAFSGRVLELLARSGEDRRAVTRRVNLGDLSWEAQLADLPDILSDAANVTGRSRSPQYSRIT